MLSTNINELVNCIKVLKNNSHYRVRDVIYKKGPRWKNSMHHIINDDIYNDTILKEYILQNRNKRDRLKPVNLKLLKNIINNHVITKKYKIPNVNELVMHLRLGDTVTNSWYMGRPYLEYIAQSLQNNKNINILTIVTCFAYQPWSTDSLHLKVPKSGDWIYTQEKHNQNVQSIETLLNKINNTFDIPIRIVSNTNIDKDMCYCASSKNFLPDGGNFSNLLLNLTKI